MRLLSVHCSPSTQGIRAPADVSVVGFDDIPLADHYCPALTTIRQPQRELGVTAVRMLLERIHDVEADIPNQRLSGELIVREEPGACTS